MTKYMSDSTRIDKPIFPSDYSGAYYGKKTLGIKEPSSTNMDAFLQYFQTFLAQSNADNTKTYNLEMKIQHISERISEMFESIQQIRIELSQRPLSSTITIHEVGDKKLKVVCPISVVLNETDDESLARWPETRASGIGATLGEAISNLKKDISYLYFDLKSRPIESLGDIALDTLNIFETHLQIIK